jgi:hypothetical protein
MVNKINVSVFLNPHINKAGQSKIYLQISIMRKIRRYPLELFVDPAQWDPISKRVAAGKDKDTINRSILRELNKVNDIYLSLRDANQDINFETFETRYFNKDNTQFSKVVDLHCQNITNVSAKPFNTVKNEIINLFGDLPINKIDLNKIQEYNNTLKDYANNTVWSKHKVLRSIINTAIRFNIYKSENPYKRFKIRFVQTLRTHLTMDELNLIESKLNTLPDPVKNAALAFLVQCYPG